MGAIIGPLAKRDLNLMMARFQNFELVIASALTRLHKSTGSPEPLLIILVISTSPYGFIMIKKIAWTLRSSSCRTHGRVHSVLLI